MHVELVRVRTTDGIRLDGALQEASRSSERQPPGLPYDAVVLFSRVGGNFYGSSLMEYLAETFVKRGIAALRVNTRGHDGVCTVSSTEGGRLQGAAYEIIDDCRFDVEAWVKYLVDREYERVALLGHSLGAVKALYSQARQAHRAVTQIMAVSPPSLAHERFVTGPSAEAFHSSMAEAERLNAQHGPEMLFRATFPFPLILSAGTYLDKYGPDSRYDFLRFTADIRVPVVFTFGERELQQGGVAFKDLPASIDNAEWQVMPEVVTVPGADHFYTDCHEALQILSSDRRFSTGPGTFHDGTR